MATDYHELNWEAVPIIAAVVDVVCFLDQYNRASGTCCVTKDLGNALLSIPTRKEEQKLFAFTWDEHQYSFIVLPRTILSLHSPSGSSLKRSRLSKHSTDYHIDVLHHCHLGYINALSSVHNYGHVGDPIEVAEEWGKSPSLLFIGFMLGCKLQIDSNCTTASLWQCTLWSILCRQSSRPRLKIIQTYGQWGMTWLG